MSRGRRKVGPLIEEADDGCPDIDFPELCGVLAASARVDCEQALSSAGGSMQRAELKDALRSLSNASPRDGIAVVSPWTAADDRGGRRGSKKMAARSAHDGDSNSRTHQHTHASFPRGSVVMSAIAATMIGPLFGPRKQEDAKRCVPSKRAMFTRNPWTLTYEDSILESEFLVYVSRNRSHVMVFNILGFCITFVGVLMYVNKVPAFTNVMYALTLVSFIIGLAAVLRLNVLEFGTLLVHDSEVESASSSTAAHTKRASSEPPSAADSTSLTTSLPCDRIAMTTSAPETSKREETPQKAQIALQDSSVLLLDTAPNGPRSVHRRCAGYLERVHAISFVALLLYAVGNFAGKAVCGSQNFVYEELVRSCLGTIQSDATFLLAVVVSVVFLPSRIVSFTVCIVALNVLYHASKLLPMMIVVIPYYFWTSVVVFSLESLSAIALRRALERHRRDQFELYIQHHLRSIEITAVRKKTEQMVAAEIPLRAARHASLHQDGVGHGSASSLFAWSSSATSCMLYLEGFSRWEYLRSPCDTSLLLQRVFMLWDCVRDTFHQPPPKYHSLGDAYFVMTAEHTSEAAKHDAHALLQFALMCLEQGKAYISEDMQHFEESFAMCHAESYNKTHELPLQLVASFTCGPGGGAFNPITKTLCAVGPCVLQHAANKCHVSHALYLARTGDRQRPSSHRRTNKNVVVASSSFAQCIALRERPMTTFLSLRVSELLSLMQTTGAVSTSKVSRMKSNTTFSLSQNTTSGVSAAGNPLNAEHRAAQHDSLDVAAVESLTLFSPVVANSATPQAHRTDVDDVFDDEYDEQVATASVLLLVTPVSTHVQSPRDGCQQGGQHATQRSPAVAGNLDEKGVSSSAASGRSVGLFADRSPNPVGLSSTSCHSMNDPPVGTNRVSQTRDTVEMNMLLTVSAEEQHQLEVALQENDDEANDDDANAARNLNVAVYSRVELRRVWYLVGFEFVNQETEAEFQKYIVTACKPAVLWLSVATSACSFLGLVVTCLISDMRTFAVDKPLLWACAGVAACVVAAGLISLLGSRGTGAPRVAHRSMSLLITALYLTAIGVATYTPNIIGDSQFVWIYVMLNWAVSRPVWGGPIEMFSRDAVIAVLACLRTYFYFDYASATARQLSLYLEGVYPAIVLAIRLLQDHSERRAFALDRQLAYIKEELETDFKRLRSALDKMVPEGAAGELVARVRDGGGRVHWISSVARRLHAFVSNSFATTIDDSSFLVIEFGSGFHQGRDGSYSCASSLLNVPPVCLLGSASSSTHEHTTPPPEPSDRVSERERWAGVSREALEGMTLIRQLCKSSVYKDRVECNKALLFTAIVSALRAPSQDEDCLWREEQKAAHILSFAIRIARKLSLSLPSLRFRMLLHSGPLIGAVVDSRCVSFELFGPPMAFALDAIHSIEWRSILATERFVSLQRLASDSPGKTMMNRFSAKAYPVRVQGMPPVLCRFVNTESVGSSY